MSKPKKTAEPTTPTAPGVESTPSAKPAEAAAAPAAEDGAEVGAANAVAMPRPTPTFSGIASGIMVAAMQLEAECDKRLAASENGDLSRAKHFLHEAAQWLEKAALNLQKAGI